NHAQRRHDAVDTAGGKRLFAPGLNFGEGRPERKNFLPGDVANLLLPELRDQVILQSAFDGGDVRLSPLHPHLTQPGFTEFTEQRRVVCFARTPELCLPRELLGFGAVWEIRVVLENTKCDFRFDSFENRLELLAVGRSIFESRLLAAALTPKLKI